MRSKRATRRRQTTLPHPSTTLTRRWATTATPMEVHRLGPFASRAVIRRWETRRRWGRIWSKRVQHLSLVRQLVGETGATAQLPVERGRGQEPGGMLSSKAPPVQRTSYRQASVRRGQGAPVPQLQHHQQAFDNHITAKVAAKANKKATAWCNETGGQKEEAASRRPGMRRCCLD